MSKQAQSGSVKATKADKGFVSSINEDLTVKYLSKSELNSICSENDVMKLYPILDLYESLKNDLDDKVEALSKKEAKLNRLEYDTSKLTESQLKRFQRAVELEKSGIRASLPEIKRTQNWYGFVIESVTVALQKIENGGKDSLEVLLEALLEEIED